MALVEFADGFGIAVLKSVIVDLECVSSPWEELGRGVGLEGDARCEKWRFCWRAAAASRRLVWFDIAHSAFSCLRELLLRLDAARLESELTTRGNTPSQTK